MRFRNFDNLRSFIVVASHLSMRAAAEELNLTKRAISYQIQQLEAELGFDVFSRSKRKLSLTEKGSDLLQVSSSLFDNVELGLTFDYHTFLVSASLTRPP